MRGVVAHGALLAAALVLALVTWTSPVRTEPGEASVPVWDHRPADVVAVSFQGGDRSLLIERRAHEGERYLWARETALELDPLGRDVIDEDALDGDDSWRVERVEEFPVGAEGEALVEQLAQLRALRDLGEATPEKRESYRLSDTAWTVTVRLRDGRESVLALGGSVVGGGDRYALDRERNRFYVLPAILIRPLENPGIIRLAQHQTFSADDVATVTVHAGGRSRSAQRRTSGTPPRPSWVSADGDRQDPAFAGMMEQIDRLWVSRFAADVSPASLEPVLRVDYRSRRGTSLGYLELFRRQHGEEPALYYMKTGRTIVPGEIYTPLAERIVQEVDALFQHGSPRPE